MFLFLNLILDFFSFFQMTISHREWAEMGALTQKVGTPAH